MAVYPGDLLPRPKLTYGTTKLVQAYGGFPLIVQKATTADATSVAFVGDNLDTASLNTFLSGEPYGKVLRWNNQQFAVGDAVAAAPPIEPPRIKGGTGFTGLAINGAPALLFEGGSHSGTVFGLDIPASIQSEGIKANKWTVMMVIRPTSSMFRNQQRTPDDGEGTLFSLEATEPFQASGTTTAGSPVITNVTPIGGLSLGMTVSGPAFPDGGAVVTNISVTGPGVGDVTVAGALAALTFPLVTVIFSTPLARLYADGKAGSPGAFAYDDHTGGFAAYSPSDSSGVEIGPIVLSWTCNGDFFAGPIGLRSHANEIAQSKDLTSFRTNDVITAFIGRWGGAMNLAPPFGGRSKSGDFWCCALMVWDVALSTAQAAMFREALYTRFNIRQERSRRSAHNIIFLGDSIVSGYNTLGLYGFVPRLQDRLRQDGLEVRVMNFSVPGSQVTPSVGTPTHGSTNGLFASIARACRYGKAGKNVVVIMAGGNDAIDVAPFTCEFDIATDEVIVYNTRNTSAGTAAGLNVLQFAAGGIPGDLSIGAVVENVTVPGSIPGGTTVTAVNLVTGTVTLSANVAAPGVGSGDTIRFRYHNMVVGNRLHFLTLPGTVTGITAGATPIYYVKTLGSAGRYTIAATPGGATINIGGTNGVGSVEQYTKNANDIFGTPSTKGLQKLVADCNAAGADRVYLLPALKRTGDQYNFILDDLRTLINGGGAGGYTVIDPWLNATMGNNDSPPNTAGPAYPDGTHLNELGSQVMAEDVLYPPIQAYLIS